MRRTRLLALLALAAAAAWAQPAWRGYDEAADAGAEIARAQALAATGGKRVLVVFGANWCGDCRVLDQTMKHGRLKALVDERYVVVKVDVGRFDRNVDLAQRCGVPLKKGIPAVAVLAADGTPAWATAGGELASARSMGEEGLVRFFERSF